MDAQQFLAEFAHFVNAPDGISKLRQLVYHMAVTGRLVPQLVEESNAETLLNDVESKRKQLIKAKCYKRIIEFESDPIVVPDGISVPSTWRWTRLLDIGEINPRNAAEDDADAVFLPMSAVSQRHGQGIVTEIRKWGAIKKGFTHFANGDVVLAKITPCFENGKSAVISNLPGGSGIGAGTTELHVFRPIHAGIVPEYVYVYLRSPMFALDGERNMTGTAGQKRLPTSYFATRAFPLAPSEEQVRIAAKVDELMALCDKLEAQQQDRRSVQASLRDSALRSVALSRSTDEMNQSWSRLESNFQFMLSLPDDVRAIRDAALYLALRGAFLDAGSASLDAPDLGDDLLPLPRGWKWKTLGDLSDYITSGSRGWKEYLSSSGDRFIRSQDIKHDALLFENPAFVALPEKIEGKRTLVHEGDLLITITGANVGKCALVRTLAENAYVSQHVALIRMKDAALSRFIHYWMTNAYGGRTFLFQFIYGDKPGLNLKQVSSVLIPVPASTDLDVVMAKAELFEAVCLRLRGQLEKAQTIAVQLAEAMTEHFTGVSVERVEELPMRGPKVELIAPLYVGEPPDVQTEAPLTSILLRSKGMMSARDLCQRFSGEDIEAFYEQLKVEVAHGWIKEPAAAEVRQLQESTEN